MINRKNIAFDFAGTLVKMRPVTLLINKALLVSLSKKFNLVIITGAKRPETINILNKLEIKNYFVSVITADDTIFRKPNPQIFNALPSVYIGDSSKDNLLARNANIKFYRVNPKNSINQIIKSLLK